MKISDEQIARVSEEPAAVALEVCKLVTGLDSRKLVDSEDLVLEVTLFLFAMQDNELLKHDVTRPPIENGKVSVRIAYPFIQGIQTMLQASMARDAALELQQKLEARFSLGIQKTAGFEFTDGDLKEVQENINQLRDLIANCPDLGEDHKRRLLKRLEQVQSELHKRVSTLDHLYCLAIEASIVAGKVGENAKPVVAVAKALMGIVWRTHTHAAGLPSGYTAPLLGRDSDIPTLE